MRIQRLDLIRHGHFTNFSLALDGDGPAPQLTVICGHNEAGKSTTRRAILDLLFGFGHRSDDDFLHPGKLLVGAQLLIDGQTVAVQRRKGRGKTLENSAKQQLADDAVFPDALRRMGLEEYARLFGLDHAILRAGGQAMLTSGGELGHILLSAGGHLHAARALEQQLRADAEELFNPEFPRRNSAIKTLLGAHREQAALVKQRSLNGRRWREAEEAVIQAQQQEQALQAEQSRLAVRERELTRLKTLIPLLAQWDHIMEQLAPMQDAPLLAADLRARWEAALAARQQRQALLDQQRARLQAARTKRDALPQRAAIVDVAQAVRALGKRRDALLNARAEQPQLQAETDLRATALRALMAELGVDVADWRAAQRALPTEAALNEARAALAELTALQARAEQATQQAQQARRALETAQAEAPPQPGDDAALSHSVQRVREQSDLSDHWASESSVVAERLQGELHTALAALPLWSGDADALAAQPLPDARALDRFAQSWTQSEQDLRAAEAEATRRRQAVAEVDARQAEWAAQGASPPSREQIAEARAQRDAELEALTQPDAAQWPQTLARARLAAQTADQLSDAALAQAQRLHAQERLRHDAAQARAALTQAESVQRQAQQSVDALAADWRALWAEARIEPWPPAEMRGWLRKREAALQLADKLRAQQAALAALGRRRAEAAQEIAEQLNAVHETPQPQAELGALLRQAESVLRRIAQQREARSRFEAAQQTLTQQARQRRDATDAARAALTQGQQRWRQAAQGLGAPDLTPQQAGAALAQWPKARAEIDAIAERDQRLRSLDAEEAQFAAEAKRLQPMAQLRDAPEEPLAWAVAAEQALADALRLETQRESLIESVAEQEAAEAGELIALTRAQAEVNALLDLCPGADVQSMATAIARSEQRRALEQERDKLASHIVRQAAPWSLEQARSAVSSADAEAMDVELVALEQRLAELHTLVPDAREARVRAQSALQELTALGSAAAAEQQRQSLVADLIDNGEQWLREALAARLLSRAIERFRERHKSPILDRANAIFTQLTGGSFHGFLTDEDAAGGVVLQGRRPDDSPCPISGMSDGTQDQMYLALRLATVEARIAAHGPLPFIADDLFVHFDDARASAGLDALLALGEQTQVLLFTHHPHLAELAQRRGGDACRVIELSR
ncbi:AAA family ATPase [Magnetofaba australis]|uniref:YhaN AAA domain-containing protein n=1 Tax=Magnetofaba australis IT-1 TaxID=1434232 RepID=A0A1Y2K1J1_9PROT|nr:AAA family ATPase [Magnetofaba australis]OSM00171.1 hypothetical protein MAIT1_00615 [Magnetofaba australis IT-1]